MRAQAGTVDYSLRRRALLRELHSGRVGTHDVCDASPYLLSAARFHGETTEERCPVCRKCNLTHVHYIYGDELKQSAGQARSRAELAMLARTARQVQVYVVEVCRDCRWNHLVKQFLLTHTSVSGDQPPANTKSDRARTPVASDGQAPVLLDRISGAAE